MRNACAILVGAIALAIATPVLAKSANATAEAPKAEEQAAPPACHSYVQTQDGDWKPVPCEEVGTETHTPPRKHAGGSADVTAH
jgi:hypothetical protein